jgi:hypothetical protein
MTPQQWISLKEQGYKIRTSAGIICPTNQKHTEHAICKSEGDGTRTIAAYVNFATVKELIKLGFEREFEEGESRWLNTPQSIFSEFQQPMIITF